MLHVCVRNYDRFSRQSLSGICMKLIKIQFAISFIAPWGQNVCLNSTQVCGFNIFTHPHIHNCFVVSVGSVMETMWIVSWLLLRSWHLWMITYPIHHFFEYCSDTWFSYNSTFINVMLYNISKNILRCVSVPYCFVVILYLKSVSWDYLPIFLMVTLLALIRLPKCDDVTIALNTERLWFH